MNQNKSQDTICPKCQTDINVYSKTLLIEDVLNAETPRSHLRVDQVKKEFIKQAPLEQFIDGLFCEKCDCGFIPNSYLKCTKKKNT